MKPIQLIACLALAFGAGLFVFGHYLSPRLDPTNAATFANFDRTEFHTISAMARGVGGGFFVLGVLGLAVPWINEAEIRRKQDATSSSGAPTTYRGEGGPNP